MFSFHGGMLWIDFINTEFLHQAEVRDQLEDWPAFTEWAQGVGLEVPSDVTGDEWYILLELRGNLRRMAEETVAEGRVPEIFVEWLNERLMTIRGTWRVEQLSTVFWPEGDVIVQIQWSILYSVMDFLVAKSVTRLKKCGNHNCIQYYYDTSKNNTRRWCRMEVCGNREKAKRHYQKKTCSSER